MIGPGGGISDIEDKVDIVDSNVDDIKVVTDAIPDAGAMSSIAQGSDLATLDGKVALDSTVAKELTLSGVETKVDTIDDNQDVATADTMSNVLSRDVIGNKDDNTLSGPGNDSLYGIAAFMSYYHVHSPSLVYPRDADPIVLQAVNAGTTWSEGTKVEVISAGVKTEAFDIHHVILGAISATGNYVVKIYTGAALSEVFWGECAFNRDSNQVRGSQVPIQGPPIPAGTRISASLLSNDDNGQTVAIKLYTHEYPQ